MKAELSKLFDEALTHIPNAREGLPKEAFYFVSQLTPMINVDLLIKNKSGMTLLTWREDNFYGPGWHIPGGIIRFKENIETRINKVATMELSCTVRFSPAPVKVCGLINNDRDIRGHFISMLYLCELTSEPDPALKFVGGKPRQGQWAWHESAPDNLIKAHSSFRVCINETKPL